MATFVLHLQFMGFFQNSISSIVISTWRPRREVRVSTWVIRGGEQSPEVKTKQGIMLVPVFQGFHTATPKGTVKARLPDSLRMGWVQ